MNDKKATRSRRLIEEWLPIAELSAESVRERRSMSALPPTYYLHVWFARRPLVASRAAILASLLSADANQEKFLFDLGIHGDSRLAALKMSNARATGERIENPYGYDRAFLHLPDPILSGRVVLDPTAGGGSIPFEAVRLGADAIANDLNPVAALILRATVEFPSLYGIELLHRFNAIAAEFLRRAKPSVSGLFPPSEPGEDNATFLWARSAKCPYCEGIVPLSPNWRLSSSGQGVRLHAEGKRIVFEIVDSEGEQSPSTVKGGDALCPFPGCGRTIDGDEIKKQAQAGEMRHQLYCVVYRKEVLIGKRTKTIRAFRAPRPGDDTQQWVSGRLREKTSLWRARNILPDEEFPKDTNDDRPRQYGAPFWKDLFSSRQLFGNCMSVEIFHDLVRSFSGSDVDRAALSYLALALDKVVYYNNIGCHWDPTTGRVRSMFDRHDFSFKWSYAEMVPTVDGLGYDWAIEQTGKSLRELVELLGRDAPPLAAARPGVNVTVLNQSGDSLLIESESIDAVVMDPPYYDNVMYAELADFFYVWLKRTAGLLYPELFAAHLSNKDQEAVANPAKFKGQKGGAKILAGLDYQRRMARIFREQRRVLKQDGIMIVMFTHKAAGAWDALATGLIDAGFTITASWPINTEAEASLHIREKSAARSTIFLVCRVRDERPNGEEATYWEDAEPRVAEAVRRRVVEFQAAGIGGIDLYLACFGPALQVFTEAWPLVRGRARPEPKKKQHNLFGHFDPYSVRPEDALDAARTEVKRWRMEQLATVKRQHHLDALTEWYVLAWDAFRAPRFPADEGLKLARVVGLDFDQQVKNVVCEMKGDDLILWDSKTRHERGKLGHVGDECMLDTLQWAAWTGREQNTGAARSILEGARLSDDPTLLTALEAMLNVLPPATTTSKKKKEDPLLGAASDFEALERLRRLAFADQVPEPKIPEQTVLELVPAVEEEEGDGEAVE